MGFPWRRLAAIGKLGGLFIPGLTAAIDTIQAAMPNGKGSDKKALVEAVSESILATVVEWDKLTPAQADLIRRARSEAIDCYVAARNAETQAREAFEALQAAIESVKPHGADGTGQP